MPSTDITLIRVLAMDFTGYITYRTLSQTPLKELRALSIQQLFCDRFGSMPATALTPESVKAVKAVMSLQLLQKLSDNQARAGSSGSCFKAALCHTS